jgi:hypothetical protein
MAPHAISHKLICESQCIMARLDCEILLISKSSNLRTKIIT